MASTPEHNHLIASEPVAGPSRLSPSIVEAYPLVVTPGGSIQVVEQQPIHYKLMACQPDLLDAATSSDEDVPMPPPSKKPKNSSKPLYSKKLDYSEIQCLVNCIDSGSEEEEEEEAYVDEFDDYNDTVMARHIHEEESSSLIESNYLVLQSYKQYERERLDEDEGEWEEVEPVAEEMQAELVAEEIQVEQGGEEIVVVNEGRRGELEVEVHVERLVHELVEVDEGGLGQLNEVELQVEHTVEEQVADVVEEYVFDWKQDFESFTVQKEVYSRPSGPTISSTCPYELFTAVWNESVMNTIVEEINRYAEQVVSVMNEHTAITAKSRFDAWEATNKDEIKFRGTYSSCVKEQKPTTIREQPVLRLCMFVHRNGS